MSSINKRMHYDKYLDHMNDVTHDVDVSLNSYWIRKLEIAVVDIKLCKQLGIPSKDFKISHCRE